MNDWLTPLLAFLGAALGAAATWWGTLRETDQQARQGRSEEWGRRFTAALEDIVDDDPRRREIGRVVLVELAGSALATAEERRLAERVLDAGARLGADGDDVTDPRAGVVVDEIVFVQDTDGEEGVGP
ncbi:MAG: hypothetical protein ACRCYR_12435 [Phycicoccus sp.]